MRKLTGANQMSETVSYKAEIVSDSLVMIDVKAGRHVTGSYVFMVCNGEVYHQSTQHYSVGRGLKPIDLEYSFKIAKRILG